VSAFYDLKTTTLDGKPADLSQDFGAQDLSAGGLSAGWRGGDIRVLTEFI
jgi:hypothetical protein